LKIQNYTAWHTYSNCYKNSNIDCTERTVAIFWTYYFFTDRFDFRVEDKLLLVIRAWSAGGSLLLLLTVEKIRFKSKGTAKEDEPKTATTATNLTLLCGLRPLRQIFA